MNNPVTLFIVEGEARDLRFAKEMKRRFLRSRDDLRVVCLPAGQNIYMLYQKLAADDFETDVVEVLRESVPAAAKSLEGVSRDSVEQVYLFFDYDPHQNNAAGDKADDMLEKMISAFCDEHEGGKLYVSYPMVEALYDYRAGQCQSHSGCFVSREDIPSYKRLSGEGNLNTSKRMEFEQWKDSISCFVLRCKCLFGMDEISFDLYRERVTVEAIFDKERGLLRKEGKVFVLSAFPEFLLDYFDSKFFTAIAPLRNLKFDECPLERG